MLSTTWIENGSKRRRIMVIIDDETIIDEIEKSASVSSLNQNKILQNNKELTTDLPRKDSLICVICGSPALGYNFGAIACESCKAFFRRNSQKNLSNLHCKNQGTCEITEETRRYCVPCRLTKCLNNGMTRDRLTKDAIKILKYRKIEENRNLLSNSTCQLDEDIDIFCTDFSDLLPPQPQQTLLISEDFQRIENISFLYQKRIELAEQDGLPWNPSAPVNTFSQFLNSRSVSIMRFLSFIKQIPEFSELNLDDKVTLVKSNLLTATGINSVLHYNSEKNQLLECDSDIPLTTKFFRPLHGYETCAKITKIFESILSIAKYDRNIIQLALIILILTRGLSINDNSYEQAFNDNKSVQTAQNYFIELLWKYMEAMHGYKTAFDLFTQLILRIMTWQSIQEQINNDVLRSLGPEDVDQLLPIFKTFVRIQ